MNKRQEKRIFNLIKKKKSLLITGCAGTGKSTMIQKIVTYLQTIYRMEDIGVTALTGIASLHISGKTIHSYLKIGIEKYYKDMLKKIRNRRGNVDTWRNCKCLIIDEVSMMGGNFFEQLHEVATILRKNNKLFGDIQLILIGDFFQLPPVTKKEETPEGYLFESHLFKQNIKYIVELDYVHRQKDPVFLKVLDEVRYGKLSEFGKQKLMECVRPLDTSDGIKPTMLFSLNINVNSHNETELNKLEGALCEYKSDDYKNKKRLNREIRSDQWMLNKLNASLIPSLLKLKVGAQVMYLKNDSEQDLFNGSRGVVVSFKNDLPVVKFKNGIEISIDHYKYEYKINKGQIDEIVLTRRQLPLKLAWAVTIHKCQGLTLDKVIILTKNIFAAGQFYVALSRVRTLGGLQLLDLNVDNIMTDPRVIKFYARFNDEIREAYNLNKEDLEEEINSNKNNVTSQSGIMRYFKKKGKKRNMDDDDKNKPNKKRKII